MEALERLREEVTAKLRAEGPARGMRVKKGASGRGTPVCKGLGAREADGGRGSAESSSVTKTSCSTAG